MAERKRKPAGGAACKRTLADWPLTSILGLLRDLSPENRAFLQARLLPAVAAGDVAAAVERRLAGMVTPTAVYDGRYRHADMKRVVDQFEKGTDDPALVARVLVADLDASCRTFDDIGDCTPLADHLMPVILRLHKTLLTVPPARLGLLAKALAKLATTYGRCFGYGVSDELTELAQFWTAQLADAGSTSKADENAAPARPEPDF